MVERDPANPGSSSRSRWSSCLSMLARICHRVPTARVLGRRGEKLAERYLRRQGHRIVDRNVRLKGGELDLVTVENRTLVIVEVKTRRSPGRRSPASAVTRAKQTRICQATRQYIRDHDLPTSSVRFDIIAITWPDMERPQLEHQRGAFDWRVSRAPGTPIIPYRSVTSRTDRLG